MKIIVEHQRKIALQTQITQAVGLKTFRFIHSTSTEEYLQEIYIFSICKKILFLILTLDYVTNIRTL